MFTQLINTIANYSRQNLQIICFGITAVALMLAGPTVNGILRRITKNLHWLLRYLSYIILCTAGYGFLSHVLYQGLRHWFRGLNNHMLVIWVAVVYLVLAFFAKQQKEI